MYGACVLALATTITGLSTLSSLKAMIGQQHAGATADTITTALYVAVVLIVVRGLIGGGMWLWAARDTIRRRPQARVISTIAFVIATLGLAGLYFQVPSTTTLVRLLILAEWAVGVCALAFAWLWRDA
jgi:uncharacterized membrane protein YhhN